MNLKELHHFWFDEITIASSYYERKVPQWFFGKDLNFDQSCKSIFSPWLNEFPEGDLSPADYVALIILFDQIPRNSFRGSSKAFFFDTIAQKLCLNALESSIESQLSLPEKMFLYLPLEHAENKELQQLSVKKFKELDAQAPEDIKSWTNLALDKAIEHQKVIEEHGGFPHRIR